MIAPATGEVAWTSEAEPGLFGADRVGAGVAVLPDERYTSQQLVDTATGAVLPERDDYVLAGNDLLVVVSDDTPVLTTVEQLR